VSHYSIWDTIWCAICVAPFFLLIFMALADWPKPRQEKQKPYREIRQRDLSTTDERAGFVQAKLEKIERASR
jgi:hypothetical protein